MDGTEGNMGMGTKQVRRIESDTKDVVLSSELEEEEGVGKTLFF